MSVSRGRLGRLVAIAIVLAAGAMLLAAERAGANFYSVVQCGWGAGADADWWDSTGGAKFRPDGYCAGGDGDHLKSFTRDGQSAVTGTRFARWRWNAPPTTLIREIRADWWHALHDGMEQRIGGVDGSGAFSPFRAGGATDTTPRMFTNTFTPSVPAVEDRLLCARGDDKWCSLEAGSWSGLRAVMLTIDDGVPPGAWITGGTLTDGGWRRGGQWVGFAGYDAGGGVRYGETLVDGGRVGFSEYSCEKTYVEGAWRGTRMRPCATDVSGTVDVDTTRFGDGVHVLDNCETDFAGNVTCAGQRSVAIDNHPPTAPRELRLAGGAAWRRVDDFDFSWANPDQGPASPIGGALWRIVGPAGYDSGVKLAAGRGIGALPDRSVPRPGVYTMQLWLRDEAGNDNPAAAAQLEMRFDDVPPGLAFALEDDRDERRGDGLPATIRALVDDAHSGPAGGTIYYRRLNAEQWIELPTKLRPGDAAARAALLAPTPELQPGTYVFRAEAVDGAGNRSATSLRADGTEMALRRTPPPLAPGRPAGAVTTKPVPRQDRPGGGAASRTKTHLFARLRGGHGRGDSLTIPFGAPALVSGRLTRADGAGLAGRQLRIVARPSRGALAPRAATTVATGRRGGFELRLPPGPSRRVSVRFAGDAGMLPARRPALVLRVRSGVSLRGRRLSLRTGQALRLSGRVRSRGAAVPRRGKLVAIQYLEAATRRWRPVLVTRTDHAGRFRARYRFRYISGAASIQLRALALAEERWPYAPGASRPLTVQVRGR